MRLRALGYMLLLLSPPAALASGLEEKAQDLSFSFSYDDTEDFGTTFDLAGTWTYIFPEGHAELGATAEYLEIDLDGGGNVNSVAVGPAVIFNFTPEAGVTGFVSGNVVSIGGDAGDIFDFGAQVAIGIRGFVGDSASVDVSLSRQRLYGKDGVEDSDTTALTAGLSIFFGKR